MRLTNVSETFYLLRKNVRLAMDPIIHEEYNSGFQLNNDIALLKLVEHVDTNIHTPACLAPVDADYTGQSAHVYGEKGIVLIHDDGRGVGYILQTFQAGAPLPPAQPTFSTPCLRSISTPSSSSPSWPPQSSSAPS